MGKLTFVTGGAKSGKSLFAEDQITKKAYEKVLYIATQGEIDRDDESLKAITIHQKRRPSTWALHEGHAGLVAKLPQWDQEGYDVYLMDCLSLWVNNLLFDHLMQKNERKNPNILFTSLVENMEASDWLAVGELILEEFDQLLAVIQVSPADFIMVSNEVGSGIVPADPLTRYYRNFLGLINQAAGRACDEAFFIVSGLPLTLKSL